MNGIHSNAYNFTRVLLARKSRENIREMKTRAYLAIIRPENLSRLIDDGLAYFAVRSQRAHLTIGDRIALYKSRRGTADKAGIVGCFEVTAPPQQDASHALARVFPVRIPWRPIVTSLDEPMPLGPLVASLKFVPNKANYGAALQASLKEIPLVDYAFVQKSLEDFRHSLGDAF